MKAADAVCHSCHNIVITLAPRKLLLDLLDQTRTGFYSDLLIVHWQTGIPFQKTWDVYLIMFLKLHCLNILNHRLAWCDISCSSILLFSVLYFEFKTFYNSHCELFNFVIICLLKLTLLILRAPLETAIASWAPSLNIIIDW